MTANHYSLHLRTMWSSVPETVPIGVATPASKHIGVVGASFRGLFPLLMMSASGTNRTTSDVRSSVAIGGIADMARAPTSEFDPLQTTGFRLAATRRPRPRRSSISPNGQNQAVKEAPEQIVAQLNGGAAQAVGLAGPMNAPMKKTAGAA